MNKFEIRTKVKNIVNSLSEEEKRYVSNEIFSRVEQLPEFINAKYVLVYYSLDDEVNTHDFISKYQDKKNILLPVIKDDELVLKKYQDLRLGKYNIMEPTGDVFLDYDKIDLAIIPGRAFDLNNNRLGRGKGYYDRFLNKLKCPKIGVCYSFQLVDNIAADPWDIKMYKVISEAKTNDYKRKRI